MGKIKEVLATSEVFNGLSDDDLTTIADLSRVEIYEKGKPLFVEGAAAEDFFVIELGRVGLEVSITTGTELARQVTVETLKKGQSCGFPAGRRDLVYVVTARVLEPSRVIVISWESLCAVLQANPSAGYCVMSRVASALSTTLRGVRSKLQVLRR